MFPELKNGMKAYASKLTLNADGVEFSYSAPRGQRFAVILMGAEKPGPNGIRPDEYLESKGWTFEQDA